MSWLDVSRWSAGILLLVLAVAGCSTGRQLDDLRRLHARAAYERGLAQISERQPALALSSFQEAMSLDGTVSIYPNALGLLYLELRRPDLALEQFRRATEVDPAHADGYLNLGIALAELARWEEAVSAYRKAGSLPTLTALPVLYQNLGLALYHLQRYREAEDALRFAIGLEPTMAAAFYNLGLLLVAEQRIPEARAAFQRVRELAPDTPFGQAADLRLQALGEGG
jgi:tetratricopeptide (TPR) repeat protein